MVNEHSAQESGANEEQNAAYQDGQPSSRADAGVSSWTTIGEICGNALRRQFRFDRNNRTWYEWREGTYWVHFTDRTIITDVLHNDRLRIAADLGDQGKRDLRDLLANDDTWRRETGNVGGEWWAALRLFLGRGQPSPPSYEVATPEGVVDIRTGEIRSHDPLIHDTVALTNGRYCPQEAESLKLELWDRLQHNLSMEDFEQLIAILGIAVARRCVDYYSILWLIGKSGSGKSTTASLIRKAFGGLGLGASADVLARRSRSDIDADLTDLLEVDPAVICISEVEKIGISRLLALTGGDVLGARRPHGRMQRGSLSGLVIATSVVPPKMAVDTGVRRRVLVLSFPARIDDSVAHNRTFSQDELDAVITLSIEAARDVGRSGWTPPKGNVEAKRCFLAEADPVGDWLESLPDDWHGRTFQQVSECYNHEMPEPATSKALGSCVSASDRWSRLKNKKTRRDHLILVGKPLSEAEMMT